MSDDQPHNVTPTVVEPEARPDLRPVLRREALLPGERSRGLGTVAVVCTMAGVASGLALATTLMAMQVADSMSARGCAYREAQLAPRYERAQEYGFLGIRYVFHDGFADIDTILEGTPADTVDLHPGDHVLAINNVRIRSASDLQDQILGARPGSTPTLLIDRHGELMTLRPTLIAWPTIAE